MEQSTIAIARRENTVPVIGHGMANVSARGSILIADEDASLANFLSQELQGESFEVEVVHDGEAAVDALREERRHDLVILDLNLPRLDGMSLIQRVRPDKPRLPMLVLTARSRVEDKVLAFQSDAQFRIRGAILDSLRVLDWSPRELRRKGRAVQEAIQTMTRNLRRTPTETEIARELNLGIHEYQLLLGQLKGLEIGSLNLEHNDDSGEDQLAYIAGSPEDDPLFRCLKGEMRQLLVDAIEELPEKERMVLTLYYYEELTMKEIGLTLGVVESRVSQIHSAAVVRLRASLHGMQKTQKPTAVRRMRSVPTDC
jgi:RNA polymerase sigma factor FliA